MFDLYVQETLDDMDKNGDGSVTVDEYVGEYHSSNNVTT